MNTVRVIIADDHQLFIDGIKSILIKELEITIIGTANNGLELINIFEQGTVPDIVITDIRMPILDGISVTRRITKEYPKVKVLALSMYDQTMDVIEMLKAGAKGYITKNANKIELVAAIHTIYKDAYYFSENLPKDIQSWFDAENALVEKALTRRELEILQLIVKGRSTIEMAQELKISRYTIDTHRKNIHKKLGIKSNTGLVRYALKNL